MTGLTKRTSGMIEFKRKTYSNIHEEDGKEKVEGKEVNSVMNSKKKKSALQCVSCRGFRRPGESPPTLIFKRRQLITWQT